MVVRVRRDRVGLRAAVVHGGHAVRSDLPFGAAEAAVIVYVSIANEAAIVWFPTRS